MKPAPGSASRSAGPGRPERQESYDDARLSGRDGERPGYRRPQDMRSTSIAGPRCGRPSHAWSRRDSSNRSGSGRGYRNSSGWRPMRGVCRLQGQALIAPFDTLVHHQPAVLELVRGPLSGSASTPRQPSATTAITCTCSSPTTNWWRQPQGLSGRSASCRCNPPGWSRTPSRGDPKWRRD